LTSKNTKNGDKLGTSLQQLLEGDLIAFFFKEQKREGMGGKGGRGVRREGEITHIYGIYGYIYTCIYASIYTLIYTFKYKIYIYVYVHIYMYVYIHIYIDIRYI